MADSTIQAIQDICASVGFNAPSVYPASIPATLFPLTITFVGPMEFRKHGVTNYAILVILAAVSAGINPDAIFQQGTTLLKDLRTAFRVLGSVDGHAIDGGGRPTMQGGYGAANGLMRTIAYAGQEYYGSEVLIPLLEQ